MKQEKEHSMGYITDIKSFSKAYKDSWDYVDKNGNLVRIPNEWWNTEEGRKK